MNTLEKILEEIDTEVQEQRELCKGLEDTPGYRLYEKTASVFKGIIMKYMDEVENDGWIPVSERIPEVPEGTEDVYCPEFNVTIKGASKATTLKYAPDGTWFDDSGEVYNVIAWQLLPEPYKGGDEK